MLKRHIPCDEKKLSQLKLLTFLPIELKIENVMFVYRAYFQKIITSNDR